MIQRTPNNFRLNTEVQHIFNATMFIQFNLSAVILCTTVILLIDVSLEISQIPNLLTELHSLPGLAMDPACHLHSTESVPDRDGYADPDALPLCQ